MTFWSHLFFVGCVTANISSESANRIVETTFKIVKSAIKNINSANKIIKTAIKNFKSANKSLNCFDLK